MPEFILFPGAFEIPPLEKWAKPMRWLLREQRERIQSAEFFQLLPTHGTRKYLALARAATATARGPQPQPAAGAKPPPDSRGSAQWPLIPSGGKTTNPHGSSAVAVRPDRG